MNIERLKQRLLALGYTETDLRVPRAVTEEEFQGMSVDLQEWHLLANPKAIQKLDAQVAEKEAEAARRNDADVDRFWGRANQEEINSALEMAARFCRKYPQFVQAEENTQQIVEWLKAHRLAKPTMSDFENAFAALCRAGSISIDLSKIPGESERTDANNKILLDYIAKAQAGLPFDSTQLLAAFDAVKDQLELKSNVATHGATRVVDYTPRRSTSELLDDTKLKKKIKSMSAAEYAAWLRENPSGRSALDTLA